jgi:hypothetical protein
MCGLLAKTPIVVWSLSATFIRLSRCDTTRHKGNEYVSGSFPAGVEISVFASGMS